MPQTDTWSVRVHLTNEHETYTAYPLLFMTSITWSTYFSHSSVLPASTITRTTGCSGSKEPDNKTSVDYTVVENADLPEELKKLIESKKDKVMRLTYTTKDYTYVVAGYGTRETSGYSIKVNDVYTGDNALYIDLNLIGPAAGEAVNEIDTYPVIVLKMERREESVVFKM